MTEMKGTLSLKAPMSVRAAEEFSRVRLSQSFFMRDFLFSEIAAIERMSNLPDDQSWQSRLAARFARTCSNPCRQRSIASPFDRPIARQKSMILDANVG